MFFFASDLRNADARAGSTELINMIIIHIRRTAVGNSYAETAFGVALSWSHALN